MSTKPQKSNSSKSLRTLNLVPGDGEMLKPAELIDIDGATGLTLHARRLYNQLIAHAFGPDMGKEGQEWAIPLVELRGAHKSNQHVAESIVSLMKTIATVRLADGRTRRVQLLGGNDMGEADRKYGTLTYSFDPKLVPLLRESSVFGKLELAVIHAFTTKYGLALYEALSRRVRLNGRFYEDFDLTAFRELLGVPDGKLATFSNLKLRAITPAVEEINAIASFGCQVQPVKAGRKVIGVRVYWHQKDVDALKAAYQELQRHKTGRRARLHEDAETVIEDTPSLFQ
ncbi:replication initiation protein [uncultured Tateyamaria sp.]|uniref:replication initiation protein n=1 Tax=uncultured Tateyamaria sp. TaxID=455651 RepID=UPI0026342999|nr:replication initiation protein [uncultured Tateyamaria sp.]